jgi:hypothetical protein
MKMRSPTARARLKRSPIGGARCSRAKLAPACSARTLLSSSRSLPLYCSANSFSITEVSISISAASAPGTMMFLNSVRWRGSS